MVFLRVPERCVFLQKIEKHPQGYGQFLLIGSALVRANSCLFEFQFESVTMFVHTITATLSGSTDEGLPAYAAQKLCRPKGLQHIQGGFHRFFFYLGSLSSVPVEFRPAERNGRLSFEDPLLRSGRILSQ